MFIHHELFNTFSSNNAHEANRFNNHKPISLLNWQQIEQCNTNNFLRMNEAVKTPLGHFIEQLMGKHKNFPSTMYANSWSFWTTTQKRQMHVLDLSNNRNTEFSGNTQGIQVGKMK